jgi:hypothetical protein
VKAQLPRPSSADVDTHRGIARAIAGTFNKPLLIDQAADADFASMIDRLRGEPGSSKGGKQ